MRLLLDTHVFIWTVMGSPQLPATARRLIEAADQVYVSSASIWEVASKARLGKIDVDVDALVDAITASNLLELPVRAVHAAGVARLPLHHADPFDRILVAQAMVEPLKLLTADAVLKHYGDVVVIV